MRPKRKNNSLDAVHRLEFSSDELAEIDRLAGIAGTDLWRESAKH